MKKILLLIILISTIALATADTDCITKVTGKVYHLQQPVKNANIQITCQNWMKEEITKKVKSDNNGNFKTYFLPFECWDNDTIKVYAKKDNLEGIAYQKIKNFKANIEIEIRHINPQPTIPEFKEIAIPFLAILSIFLFLLIKQKKTI